MISLIVDCLKFRQNTCIRLDLLGSSNTSLNQEKLAYHLGLAHISVVTLWLENLSQ